METSKKHENYPIWIVLFSNLASIAIYALGFLIIHKIGLFFSILYLIFVLTLEYRVIRHHCINCFYWGKTCGFGKGQISSWFFKKGDNSRFCAKQMTWKDLIPDILVSAIPLIIGIVLLIFKFDFILISEILILLLLTIMGNGFIRSTLTCGHCIQKELGCPADMLFNKK